MTLSQGSTLPTDQVAVVELAARHTGWHAECRFR